MALPERNEKRILRRIERDDGDTTRKENTEQAKLAASVHRRAKTDFRESSGSVDEIIFLGDINGKLRKL